MSRPLFDALGPRGHRRAHRWSIGLVAGAIGTGMAATVMLERTGHLDPVLWGILLQPDLLALLAEGCVSTLKVAIVALVLALLVGSVLAIGLMAQRQAIRSAVKAWIELFRGLPLLLLIFFLFLGAPALGIDISTFWALTGGLVLYNSAVIAEIIRAGIVALPKGQAEAGLAIGLRHGDVLRVILLPQAVRNMLPALVSQLVVLLKETSLGFVIGYTELMRDGRTAIEFLGGEYSLPVYTTIAVIYIGVNLTLSAIAGWMEANQGRFPAVGRAA